MGINNSRMLCYLDPLKMLNMRCKFGDFMGQYDLFSITFQIQVRGNLNAIEDNSLWPYVLKGLPYNVTIDQIKSLNYSNLIDSQLILTTEITLYPLRNVSVIEHLDFSNLNDNEISLMTKLKLWKDEYLCLRSLILATTEKEELDFLANTKFTIPPYVKYREQLNEMIVYYFCHLHFKLNYIQLDIPQINRLRENLKPVNVGILGNNWRNQIILKQLQQLSVKVTMFKSQEEHPSIYSPTYLQDKNQSTLFEPSEISFKEYIFEYPQSFWSTLASILDNHDEEQAFKTINHNILLFMVSNGFTEYSTVKQLKSYLMSFSLYQPIITKNKYQPEIFVREIGSIKQIQVNNKIQVKCDSKKFQFDFLVVGDSNEFINSIVENSDIKDNPCFQPDFIFRIKTKFQNLKLFRITKAICKFTTTFWLPNFLRSTIYDNSLMLIADFENNSLLIELHKPYYLISQNYESHKREIIKILQEIFGDRITRDNTKGVHIFPGDYFIQTDLKGPEIYREQNVFFNIPILYGDGMNLLSQSILSSLMIVKDILITFVDPQQQYQKNIEQNRLENYFGITNRYDEQNNYILNKGDVDFTNFTSIVNLPNLKDGKKIYYYFSIIKDLLGRKLYVLIPEDDQKKLIMERSLKSLSSNFNGDFIQQSQQNGHLIVNSREKFEEMFPNIYTELLLSRKMDDFATNEMLHQLTNCCMGSLFLGLEHPCIKLLRKSMKYQSTKFPEFFSSLISRPIITGKFKLLVQREQNDLIIRRRFLSTTKKNDFQEYHIKIGSMQEIFVEQLNVKEKQTSEIWKHMYFQFLGLYNMKYFYQIMKEFIEQEQEVLRLYQHWNIIIDSSEKLRVFSPTRLQIQQSELLYSNMKRDDTFEIIDGKLFLCQKGNKLRLKCSDYQYKRE